MNQKGQPNSNQLKQLKSQSESAASACVRGVALQSVKSMRCWAGEASTRGWARERDGRARRRLYWGSALTRWMDHRVDYMVCKCFVVCERESYTHNMC